MDCSTPGFPVLHHLPELLKLMSIESVMPSNHLILSHLLLLLPSIFPSIKVFSNESVLHIRLPKYWSSASASVLPMNIQDWFPLGWTGWISLQFKGRLLQHHSLKASVIWHSAFFIVQLLHPYMTTGKAITLTRWTFLSKVMTLLFNMLSRFILAFLPRRKYLCFILFYVYFFIFIFTLFYFTILYWFCQTLTWIHHRCTWAPTLNPLPPPSPYHLSGSSQFTSPKHPVSCIEPRLTIHFLHDSIHLSMPFSQIVPPSPYPRIQKSVLYICVSFAVSHTGSSLPSF